MTSNVIEQLDALLNKAILWQNSAFRRAVPVGPQRERMKHLRQLLQLVVEELGSSQCKLKISEANRAFLNRMFALLTALDYRFIELLYGDEQLLTSTTLEKLNLARMKFNVFLTERCEERLTELFEVLETLGRQLALSTDVQTSQGSTAYHAKLDELWLHSLVQEFR